MPPKSQSPSEKQTKPKLVVQKYGGATLADPQKIRQIAARIAELSKQGTQVVVAVSAMGKTTNQLIDLANQVSSRPSRREMDMLLTTGERVSMALVSMALQDLGCQAISFTGSQAGILTDESHVNAKIIDVKAFRVEEALHQGKVIVLAGFQGVSPLTKEITTLGRGGTDTTAVAMAAYLKADRCEILKDVAGVFSADPHVVPKARALTQLSYEQMMEMTFWGAKVLHYRSVELAKLKNVTLYIGPATQNLADGTVISNGETEKVMFESSKILGLNSHERVLKISVKEKTPAEALVKLKHALDKLEIAFPQILFSQSSEKETTLFITGPGEILKAVLNEKANLNGIQIVDENLCSVSATCTGIAGYEVTENILMRLRQHEIHPLEMYYSALSLNLILKEPQRKSALSKLHELLE